MNKEEKARLSLAEPEPENPYKKICDELQEGVVISGKNQEILYANIKAEEIFDFKSHQLQKSIKILELKEEGTYRREFTNEKEKPLILEVKSQKISWEGNEALMHLLNTRAEETNFEKLLKKSTHELKERNKELYALYKLSRLTSDVNLDVNSLSNQLLEIIPASWQFPELAQARIQVNGSEFYSENFRKNIHSQSADIFVFGKKEGKIEVGYRNNVHDKVEEPFLQEEGNLINEIAFRLGKFIEKKKIHIDLQLQSHLINSVGEAVISTDLNGNINFWNKAAENIYGWKKEEVIGKNILEVNVVPEMKNAAEDVMESLRQDKSWSGKFIVRRKSGEKFPVIVTNSPIKDENGELAGMIGISRDVSEIVKTENALKESFERLNNVADNIPGMIYQYKRTADGRDSMPFISGGCRELFGITPEEAIGNIELVFNAIHPEDIKSLKNAIDDSYQNLKAYKSQHRSVHQDGSIKWLEANSLPKKLPNGDVVWTGVVLDMTAYKKTESLLKESEERFNDISENLPGLVYQFELMPNGSFAVPYISKSAEKIFSLPHHQLKNADNLFKKILPDDIEDMMNSIFESADKMAPWFKEARVYSQQGNVKWIQGRAIPRKQTNGSILWNGVLVDITEQKIAELAVQENEEKLREAQQIAEMGNFELWLPGKKVKWSIEMSRLMGIPFSEDLVELASFKDLVDEDDKWKIPHYVDVILKKGVSASFDLKINSENTEVRYLNISAKPRKDNTGNIIAIIGTAFNITKRKTYENALMKAKEKAEESDRLKSVFLQTMSHELRTPLNAIIGFSDLILDEEVESDQNLEFTRLINNSGKHLLDIIEDIFEISALETGQSVLRYEDVELKKFSGELGLIIEEEKKKRHKNNLVTIFKPLGQQQDKIITTDTAKLKRLMLNLLVNALKFTHEGSVEYGYKIYRNRVLFYVSDTGIGIEAKKQKVIFERFRQGEESPTRQYEGVGLGLSICKIISELLGGEIWVESKKGSGSTFYFMHPLTEKAAGTIDKKEQESALHAEKPFTGKKILIVEDEKSNMHLLELMLKHQGVGILKAKNGLEALELFGSETGIDLILMDIKMPLMNGFDATREIRKSNSQIPIIALTAYAQEGDRQKAIDAGCSDYISKPLRKNILIEKLQLYLSN